MVKGWGNAWIYGELLRDITRKLGPIDYAFVTQPCAAVKHEG